MSDEKKKTNEAADRHDEEATEGSSTPLSIEQAAAELAQLREQLGAKEAEAKANYGRYIRQAAELENFKKRTARDKEETVRFANEALIRDLLSVADNLERAIEHAQDGGNGKPLVEGVEMVLKGLADVLAKHGVTQVSALGQTFDPERHEAMAHVETDAHAPNTVVGEFHKGYLLFDRLLRPALVSVAKAPETKEKKNSRTEVEKPSSDD